MANRVLATDLDGTLFYPKRHVTMIPWKNVAFLRRWIAEGNRVVLVSSRSEYFAKKIYARYGFPFDFVGYDGTYVRVGDKVIRRETFDPQPAKELFATIENKYRSCLTMAATNDYPMLQPVHPRHPWSSFCYSCYMMVQGIYREPFTKSDQVFYSELAKRNMFKVMFCIGLTPKKMRFAYHLTHVLEKNYPDFKFVWLNQFVEITPKGCDKASGLTHYLDYLNIPHENVIVVGDSGNDIPMFEAFYENSYCMSHSAREVQINAKHVIKQVSDLEKILDLDAKKE